MAQYDTSAKYLLLEHSKALIEYFLGRQNVEILEHLNTDQPTGTNAEQWLRWCVATAEAAPVEKAVRDDLVATLGILSVLAYKKELVNELIKEEIVQESTFFQEHLERATKRLTQEALDQGLQQGLQQGIKQERRKSTIRHILIVLKTKFSADIVNVLTPAIENISDVERLEQLLPAAVEARSLESFARALQE